MFSKIIADNLDRILTTTGWFLSENKLPSVIVSEDMRLVKELVNRMDQLCRDRNLNWIRTVQSAEYGELESFDYAVYLLLQNIQQHEVPEVDKVEWVTQLLFCKIRIHRVHAT
ncbi:MAG: hypothetical protein AABY26_04680 [Nanoarchaeota archaeon]|mgnify:CR=1 FL=1